MLWKGRDLTREWLAFGPLMLVVLAGSIGWAAEETVAEEAPKEPSWMVVGTFKGAADPGLLGQLSNYVFEYENDDSLFRDFGDLGIGIGTDIGSVELDLDLNFRHRIVSSQEVIPPGERVSADDISVLRKVGTSRSRLRLTWEYLPEIITADDGIAIQVEGGYSVSTSRTQSPTVQSTDPLAGLILDPETQASFKDENEVSMKDHGVVYVTAGSAAAVVDSLSGYIGNKFADTERAAVYWDNYAEPIMLFPKSGLPLRLRVFMDDSKMLAVGDRLTFTTFVAISPFVMGLDQYGARMGYRHFWRFLRETTVEKLPDSVVKVRVRNWRGRGGELTPFKYRPEVRLWIFKLGYTFFESVRDDFREKTSDEVYTVDLKVESGMEFFKKLVKQSGRVNPNPKLPEPEEIEGMETLASEESHGKNQNFRLRANFFSWYRYRKSRMATTRRIATQDADLIEAMRVTSKEYLNRFGRHKDVRNRSVIIAQSDVRWQDDALIEETNREGEVEEVHPQDEKLAVLISTNFSNRWAAAADVRALADGIDQILNLKGTDPVLEEFKQFESEERTRLTVYLDLSFGPDQIRAGARVPDEEVWRQIGELLLGSELADAWTTETKRFWWEIDAPPYTGVDRPVSHISRHYDRLRGFQHRPFSRGRIFNPAEYRSSELYRIAKKTFKKMRKLSTLFLEKPDCVKCLARGYSTGKDIFLVQAVAVRSAGGVEKGGVGYDYHILVGNMVRPIGASNGIEHGYQLPRVSEILYSAEQTWESPPRLRAGQMLVNMSGRDHKLAEGEPCGKVRLFSDHYFDDDLSLKMIWRRKRMTADRSLKVDFASLGEPTEFTQAEAEKGFIDYTRFDSENTLSSEYNSYEDRMRSMSHGSNLFTGRFEQARHFYDIYLPRFDLQPAKKGFTILMRLLNPDGLPVTEEQEILMMAPKGYIQLVPEECWLISDEDQTAETPEEESETVN